MEELWKDIATLSSSHHHYDPNPAAVAHQTSLHDFLASPTFPQSHDDPKLATCLSDSNKACSNKVAGGRPCSYTAPRTDTSPSVFASSLFAPLCSQKTGMTEDDQNSGGDARYKRRMKNRESANRSRARRQAYTNELEREVAQLRDENAMLRRQEEICLAAAAAAALAQAPKKSTLPRSFTAPF